ncbi:MAG: methyltransferase domain-containing protein [Desulfosporosinus sp.]|nr:methyltransferase domain-containing protein [Desulfosporosinus sp.]
MQINTEFKNERTQPAIDLVNRICMESSKKIIDISCGPGNSTEVLARRFKGAYIAGVDNSENMISKAKENYPHLDFSLCDVGGDLSGLDNDFDIYKSGG